MSDPLDPDAINVLLVEDNPGDVLLVREAMRGGKLANALAVAADGAEALAYVRREAPFEDAPRPDLILLDLNLPRVSGPEVLQDLKGDPATRMIPVVVMTSSEAETDIVRSYELQANCYVTKPLDWNRFVDVVASIEDFWFSIVRLPPKT